VSPRFTLPPQFHPFVVIGQADALEVRLELRPHWGNPRAGVLQAKMEGDRLRYERTDLRFLGRRGDGQEAQDSVEAIFDGSEGAFEAVIQLSLQWALRPRGGLLLHASAGIWRGGAWLMPGVSGTGKSTAARRGGFDAVLADEMVVVRRGAQPGAGFDVWGTPFWSPDRPLPLHIGRAPLHTLAKLSWARTPQISPLNAAEASAWLLSSVVLYETSTHARESAFALACDVAQEARCVRLAFPKEGPWLHKLSVVS